MSVLELFEDRDVHQENDDVFSSWNGTTPIIQQQTYVFKSAIKAIAVTRTHNSITSKEILLGLCSDQLYSMARHFLDSRRPTEEPTAEDREEGLIPYMAELPFDYKQVISYNRTIGGLRAITTSDTLLESTSVVFAYGIDLFYVRITPSQTFDLLNADFNYAFLIGTVTLVAVAIIVTRHIARKKLLTEAWS